MRVFRGKVANFVKLQRVLQLLLRQWKVKWAGRLVEVRMKKGGDWRHFRQTSPGGQGGCHQ